MGRLLPFLPILLLSLRLSVEAVGTKGYGEDCNPLNIIASVVGGTDPTRLCNSNKHLICMVNTCVCSPAGGYIYQPGVLGFEALGGGCRKRVGAPCSTQDPNSSCVANAQCSTICRCRDGYSGNLLSGECSKTQR